LCVATMVISRIKKKTLVIRNMVAKENTSMRRLLTSYIETHSLSSSEMKNLPSAKGSTPEREEESLQ
jgi:hypothetical protein